MRPGDMELFEAVVHRRARRWAMIRLRRRAMAVCVVLAVLAVVRACSE